MLVRRLPRMLEVLWRRYWRRALQWRERVAPSDETVHLLLAAGVGVIGGLVNLAFHGAIELVRHAVVHRPGDPVEVAELMGPWERVLTPALGGLVAGLILHWGLRWVRARGTTNLLEAVVAGDGRLPFRPSMVRACSSLVSIATGASIGREGGITQLSAMLASKWGQWFEWPPYRLRLLVGCGAAAGIAAAYNAPISGAVFAAWIVLGNFSMLMFAPLVVSAVVASVLSRSFFGIAPWYEVPAVEFTRLGQLPWFLVLGGLCGATGALFLKLLRYAEDQFRRLPWPLYGRMALGGLLVGLIALGYPGVCGNGYLVTNRILHGEFDRLTASWVSGHLGGEGWGLLFLIGLFSAKLLATAVTVGSGAVGGVFTPTLFVGAAVGAAFGLTLHLAGVGEELPLSSYAVVGMGSVLAATTRSPLLAMVLVFEISLNYSIMPPLMLGCAVATLVAGRLHPDSVYTESLRARGLEAATEVTLDRRVGDLMREPVPPVRETATLQEMAQRFLTRANNFLPVVDGENRLVGVVALHDLKPFLNAGEELRAVIAYDVMRPPPPCLTPNQTLFEALPVVLRSEQQHIPVVKSASDPRLVGALVRAEVLGLVSEAMARSSEAHLAPTGDGRR
ncbi:ClcB-like voltage-gated chloride channel protein [Limisphaera ngatamarikiensis]|uniref:ClcB-like voltage-gated chloride channel protein n=2 Tax=Limisphaera ngatamarikiensis TaxID=1324935 RepID=A0A6M1RCQ6_9BACT|nr:ClcB-like voltage-gated chloride channel protein [Limisphaera ngatamarikiensis]